MEEANLTFKERVYAWCRQIPKGKVTTYQEIALALGCNSSQAVGQALCGNPFAPFIPCHRVIKTNGKVGGFKGQTRGKAVQEKIKLLTEEGVEVIDETVNLEKYGWKLKR